MNLLAVFPPENFVNKLPSFSESCQCNSDVIVCRSPPTCFHTVRCVSLQNCIFIQLLEQTSTGRREGRKSRWHGENQWVRCRLFLSTSVEQRWYFTPVWPRGNITHRAGLLLNCCLNKRLPSPASALCASLCAAKTDNLVPKSTDVPPNKYTPTPNCLICNSSSEDVLILGVNPKPCDTSPYNPPVKVNLSRCSFS